MHVNGWPLGASQRVADTADAGCLKRGRSAWRVYKYSPRYAHQATLLSLHWTFLIIGRASQMAHVFALIIGIDSYKSGNIWDLTSAVDDATSVKHWLTHDLHVPRHQISFLTNNKATKRNIEDQFTNHLLKNNSIEHGDAILIYFAGLGSTITGPLDWSGGKPGEVQILCTFDHDTRDAEGRVAGISAVSLQAMLQELSEVKGNNITVIIDCCFTGLERSSHLRYTPTVKCTPQDLRTSLWKGLSARSGVRAHRDGFYERRSSHILLAACGPREKALEGKEGGRFTHSLLSVKDKVSLHRTTYAQLLGYINTLSREQVAVCVGKDKDRILFGGIPFVPDSHFVPVDWDDDSKLRIGAGSDDGIVEGSEFSFHKHNRRGSLNPPLTTLSVVEIHPTWSVARTRVPSKLLEDQGYAQVSKWSNRRMHLKKTLSSLFRRRQSIKVQSTAPDDPPTKILPDATIVEEPICANVSVDVGRKERVVEDRGTLDAMQQIHEIPGPWQRRQDLVDSAARLHLHLHRENPSKPFRNLVKMELFHLDPQTLRPIGGNLLVQGKARLLHEDGRLYQIVVRNDSEFDLWPYLACMRQNGDGISMLSVPDHHNPVPPLRKHSHLVVGPSGISCEALSLALPSKEGWDMSLLRLFVSSKSVPESLMEQGAALAIVERSQPYEEKEIITFIEKVAGHEVWDTVEGVITINGNKVKA
ncbi:hypothetical protein NEOLEDRAFT_691298 [Neolentinus lepideus HHB14362 ss-1]|uniref:Caspase domain-containing protein n=1 Tax=Neolentinus lepideus HHB14362 ss-1 TaxID=1314782 RepID=A0A165V1K1_9AGAM|nr:hypothetical protein NEOLEDRAFT_691298 [Neolentinus lepideus HHB14362 ss-1]